MLFNSFAFAVFFPVVPAAYFLTPHRLRWVPLLVASCVFYMAFIPVVERGREPVAGRVRQVDDDGDPGALSPSYFQAALRSFKAYGGRPYPREPLPDEQGGTTLPDGSRVYPRRIRERDAAQVRAEAIRGAAEPDERLRDFRELDEGLVRRLEELIGVPRAQGTDVEFLLAPYHPILLQRYHAAEDYRMVFAAEQRFRDLAAS